MPLFFDKYYNTFGTDVQMSIYYYIVFVLSECNIFVLSFLQLLLQIIYRFPYKEVTMVYLFLPFLFKRFHFVTK